jgi:acetyltransferase-like isoleucine patch superfamily enzyme
MRKITLAQTALFAALLLLAFMLGVATTWWLLGRVPLGDFRGVVLVFAALVFCFLYLLALYRIFLRVAPLTEGPIAKGSREEFVYHVYELFYLAVFYSLTRTNIVPVPLMRLVYQGLGARLGTNSYSAGTLLDPPLTTIGDNCIIGHDAVLFCHVVEGDNLELHPIRIGNNVTIGGRAMVMPGATIGDGAIVAMMSVVMKGSQIGAGEVWGGNPARKRSIVRPQRTDEQGNASNTVA